MCTTYINAAALVAGQFRQNKNVFLQEPGHGDHSAVIAALAALMLQPSFRTAAGFRGVVEAEFLQGGHRFGARCGTFGA